MALSYLKLSSTLETTDVAVNKANCVTVLERETNRGVRYRVRVTRDRENDWLVAMDEKTRYVTKLDFYTRCFTPPFFSQQR